MSLPFSGWKEKSIFFGDKSSLHVWGKRQLHSPKKKNYFGVAKCLLPSIQCVLHGKIIFPSQVRKKNYLHTIGQLLLG